MTFTDSGVKITDKKEIVEKFNNYFINIGRLLAEVIPKTSNSFRSYLKNSQPNSLSLYLTDEDEIIKIVSAFKNKYSAGHDEIPVSIIKSSLIHIAAPISKIINSSLTNGIFPDKLKIAKVCPIYKSGELDLFANFKPISVLPSFSKIFEKIVFNRLISYVEKHKILSNSQYGFRKSHSTSKAITDLYDKITTAMDENKFSMGLFIDLSKAFDMIDHAILIHKLEFYGILGIALQLFKDYLTNRKQ